MWNSRLMRFHIQYHARLEWSRGPALFTFYIAAIMITWRQAYDRPLCWFRTLNDSKLTGRRFNKKGTDFTIDDSEYADDTAVLFESREDLVEFAPLLMNHFRRFGMEIHAGDRRSPEKPSKTEVLFVAAPPTVYSNPASYDGTDLTEISLGNYQYFPVVEKFCYLGSLITRDCKDTEDVCHRIKRASNAFGSLRKLLFSNPLISLSAKGSAYRCLILPILLYGAETWCLTENLYNQLRSFHHNCVRAMNRVNLHHTYLHRISNAELFSKLDLKPIDSYITKQQLTWLGHVTRMSPTRTPRKLLTSWVVHRRPKGAPEFTYGRGIFKALKKVKIDKERWYDMARDRNLWRNIINRWFNNT